VRLPPTGVYQESDPLYDERRSASGYN
jgi:hypothetical protein